MITDLESASIGKIYRVMIRVFNREGHDDSPYLRIMNSGHPMNILNKVEIISRNNSSLQV